MENEEKLFLLLKCIRRFIYNLKITEVDDLIRIVQIIDTILLSEEREESDYVML